MTQSGNHIIDFDERWQRWLAREKLPVAEAADWDEQTSTWRHPALAGVFCTNWRFKRSVQTEEMPNAFFWTRDPKLLTQEYTCIVSSRVGRKIDAIPNWVGALRTLVCKAYRDGEAIATAQGTATHPFVHRLASLLHLPRVVLQPFDTRPSDLFAEKYIASDPQETEVFYSFCPNSAGNDAPTIDSWLIGLADQVRVLAVNSRRNTFGGTMARLAQERHRGKVWILHDDEVSTPGLRRELLEHGAVDWLLSTE